MYKNVEINFELILNVFLSINKLQMKNFFIGFLLKRKKMRIEILRKKRRGVGEKNKMKVF